MEQQCSYFQRNIIALIVCITTMKYRWLVTNNNSKLIILHSFNDYPVMTISNFFLRDPDADAHIHERTLTPMNARTHTLPHSLYITELHNIVALMMKKLMANF